MSLTDNVVTAVTSTLTSQLGQFSITGADHPAPAYQLLIDGKDVSATIRPRLMSLNITDNRGFEADTIDIELDDTAKGNPQLSIAAANTLLAACTRSDPPMAY